MRHGITDLNDDENKLNEKRGKRDPMRGNLVKMRIPILR